MSSDVEMDDSSQSGTEIEPVLAIAPDILAARKPGPVSRKSGTISDQGIIPEPSTSHIGKGVASVALAATLVYI
jgi:hypothetical protein